MEKLVITGKIGGKNKGKNEILRKSGYMLVGQHHSVGDDQGDHRQTVIADVVFDDMAPTDGGEFLRGPIPTGTV